MDATPNLSASLNIFASTLMVWFVWFVWFAWYGLSRILKCRSDTCDRSTAEILSAPSSGRM